MPEAKAPVDTDRRLDRLLRRFAYIRRENLDTFATRFAELVRAGAPPRDPRALLPRVGVTVARGLVSPPLRATCARTDDGYLITVSEHEPVTAQSFAAWRELFFLLAAQPAFPTALSALGRERLGNRFASVMLMPADAVMAMARRFAHNPQGLAEVLANRFGVSPTAMRKRLYELEILRPRSNVVHVTAVNDE